MRKDELVMALVADSRRANTRRSANAQSETKSHATPTGGEPGKRRVQKQILAIQEKRRALNDLSTDAGVGDGAKQDRLALLVRDPYWLHLSWQLSYRSVQRASKSLGQNWHAATPALRLYRITADGETVSFKTIAIHGGVNHWYVDVDEPPARFRAEIGYCTPGGDFYCLARSNEVATPAPGSEDAVDGNWNDVARNADRIYAMSGGYSQGGASLELQEMLEERLRRRLGRPSETRFGNGASPRGEKDTFRLAIDAELVVYGAVDPNAHVTVQGEPVVVQQDGAFAVKVAFPDRRQVIPIVASSSDGLEQKTVILGVERNTKSLELQRRDPGGG